MEMLNKAKWVTSSFKIALATIISMISCNVYAEYYMVAGAPCGYRVYCKVHHTCNCKKHKKVAHHKYQKHYRERYGVSITYVCPACERVWVPGHCNRCGRWVKGHWVAVASVYYAQPTYYKNYGYHEDVYYGYNPDLSTGDDNAMVDPNMDIDY